MSAASLNPKAGAMIEYLVLTLLPKILEFEKDFNVAFLPRQDWETKEKRMWLHFWCLSPSVAFREIGAQCRSVILTSGTLSPLDAVASEMGCDFQVRLEADHVIEKGQVLVMAIERGVRNQQLKLVYKNLQDTAVVADLGLSMLHLL